jgi:cell division protein DivIC
MSAVADSPQSNSKSPRSSRRKFRWLGVIVLCFLGWAGVTYWDQQSKLHEKQVEMATLNKQLSDLKATNEKSKQEVNRLNDQEYIGQMIRKELGYTKDGETRFFER